VMSNYSTGKDHSVYRRWWRCVLSYHKALLERWGYEVLAAASAR